MRNKNWVPCFTACLLSLMIGCGSVGCFASAFSMSVCWWKTVLSCLAATGLIWSCDRYGNRWLPFAVPLLLGLVFWFWGGLDSSAEAVLYRIFHMIDRYYASGFVGWRTGEPEVALCAWAVLVSLGVSRSILLGSSGIFSMLAALAPLGLCLFAIDLAPAPVWLFLLLTGFLTMLLASGAGRHRASRQGVLLVLPVALAVFLLLLAIPQKDFEKKDQGKKLADDMRNLILQLSEKGEALVERFITDDGEENRVDLSQIRSLYTSRQVIMELSGNARGTVYLRGQSLDRYDGYSWESGALEQQLPWPSKQVLQDVGELTVTTRRSLPLIYVPYYAEDVLPDRHGGSLRNYRNEEEFSYQLKTLAPNGKTAEQDASVPENLWLELPENTRRWAEAVLQRILPENATEPEAVAAAIGKFVSNSAEYSRAVEPMPDDAIDFVQWFLMDQEKGYCVHFASSAVVLLRAAGIPARYTTGYMVDKDRDVVLVRSEDAHAWAEYWVKGLGWLILEATPSDGSTAVSQTTQPAVTTPEESATHLPTETAAPVTRPTDATDPVITTEPAAPTAPVTPQEPETIDAAGRYLWLLLLPLLLLPEVWCRLRLLLRKYRLTNAQPNARALLFWQEAEKLSNLLNRQPPPALCKTAQKARFSQHTVTAEELQALAVFVRKAKGALSEKPWYLRLFYRWFYGVC